MTITTTDSTVSYTGDGSTTAFPVPFVFFEDDELEVIERVTATGVETVKTLTTDYTVTGGNGAIGTVTAVSAPAATVTWTIRRATAAVQETALTAFGALPSSIIERMADRTTAIAQEVVRDYARGLLVPKTETGLTLPNSVDRAGKYLLFDASGNPTASEAVTIGSVVMSAFMEGLMNSANSGALLTGIGMTRVAWCGTATGTANAQVLTPATALTSYETGAVLVWLTPASANTGAVTANASALGAKAVQSTTGAALVSGDLPASSLVAAVYDGSALRLLTAIKTISLTALSVGDASFTLALSGGNPVLGFDANDYVGFDRTSNAAQLYIGGALAAWTVGSGTATNHTASMAQAFHLLESYTVTGTPSQKDFDLSTYITAGFKRFRVEWRNISPAAAALLRAYFSTDAGSSWKSGAGDYGNAWAKWYSGGGFPSVGGSGVGYIQLSATTNVQTHASHAAGCSGWLEFCTDTGAAVIVASHENTWKSATGLETAKGSAETTFAGPVNAVRVQFVGQNFETYGSLHIYGSAA